MGRAPTNTKEKLLETAMDLIWQSSYGAVSVDEICHVSGVKKGSFYYYFPSKIDLAIAAMEASYQRYQPEMMDVFALKFSAIERFERLAIFIYQKQKKSYEQYGHVCGCPFASLGSEMAGNEEAIRQKADEIFRRQEHYYIKTLQEMVDAGQLHKDTNLTAKAFEIHTFIVGQVMMARIQNDLVALKHDLKSGLFRVLNLT